MADDPADPACYGQPATLWRQTAIAAPAAPSLQEDAVVDVIVVGAGYTGLSAALHLAERGRRVRVLEAADIGWGASGRNNGQVIPGLKHDPGTIRAMLGDEAGGRLVAWAGQAPDEVFALIERHRIDCAPVRNGWIQPSLTRRGREAGERRCGEWRTLGADVASIDPAMLADMLGTDAYCAGWIDRRGGSIQPLSYARGLAHAAVGAGATIHARTTVRHISHVAGHWQVTAVSGRRLRATRVILATGAYGGKATGALARSYVPVRTAQIATRPLPPSILARILPGRQVASDTRRLLTSFRISPDGRLVMGGAGATAGTNDRALAGRLRGEAGKLFPFLRPEDWSMAWSGYFAVTTDHLPHIHEPEPGLLAALGCNGRGIAISTAMGRLLATRILEGEQVSTPLPATPVSRFPMHAARSAGVFLTVRSHRALDRLDRFVY